MLLMEIMHTQKEFVRISKKFGEYRDLYAKSNTLLLADVFEKHVLKDINLIRINYFQVLDLQGKKK